MPMQGKAAIAMWWHIAPSLRAEFENWHSHEHFPERMGIPGFRRGSRWVSIDGIDGFFVMYELDCYDTLTSESYVQRLNNPTPWSTQMMPQHLDMVRSQCLCVHSSGGGIGQYALTVRFSPANDRDTEVSVYLAAVAESFAKSPGGVAFHVLRTATPKISATKEQQIRGGKDAVADWVVIAIGYDLNALQNLQCDALSTPMMTLRGMDAGALFNTYQLAYALAESDLEHAAS